METKNVNKGQTPNYSNAPRAIKVTDFPTVGFYFIHSISERMDANGNRFPVAIVDWKLDINEAWVDPEEIKYLRLDYLYNLITEGPENELWALNQLIIEVEYSCVSYSDKFPKGMPFFRWKLATVSVSNNDEDYLNPGLPSPQKEKLAGLLDQMLSSKSPLNFDYDDVAYSQDFIDEDAYLVEQQVLMVDDLLYEEDELMASLRYQADVIKGQETDFYDGGDCCEV